MNPEEKLIEQIDSELMIRFPEELSETDFNTLFEQLELHLYQLVQMRPQEAQRQAYNKLDVEIILDFTKADRFILKESDIKRFIKLIKQYGIEFIVSIPPPVTAFNQQTLIQSLNRAIPLFHHKGLFIFIVDNIEEAHSLTKKFTNQEFQYSIELREDILIFNSPVYLLREIVDKLLVELDDLFEEVMEFRRKHKHIKQNPGIIMNFANLRNSTMTPNQMDRFVQIVAEFKFRSIVSIPPPSHLDCSSVIQLLNKSLPQFNKKGIWVDFADTVDEAIELYQYKKQTLEDISP
jgi:hypothetical protein